MNTSSVLAPNLALHQVRAQQSAIRILERLLRGYKGAVALRLWNNAVHAPADEAPVFTLVVRDPGLLRRLVFERNPVLLADAYFRGVIDLEGDLYSALSLKTHFEGLSLNWRDKLALLRDAWRLPATTGANLKPAATLASRIARRFSHRHSRASDRAAIAFHYDVSNEFYRLWLDEERVYSCAYFTHAEESLEQAQRNKLEHICRKLRLRPGERLLDIGCGWGALVCWAAKHHGVQAHGITLSRQQLEFAQQRIRTEGLQDRVTVELRDYRDLAGDGLYDKVSSVGMFEHVGLANLPTYLATVQRVLRPGGLFLNHGITHDEEGWNKTVASEFINRYVFPDGELDCVSNIQLGMERTGFEIHDVEGLRPHYALTLRHWVQRLEAQREAALREVDEPTYRVWRLYMAACALEFESGGTGIYQILASKRNRGEWPVPLSRHDVYVRPPLPVQGAN
ncbi:MAG: cyclopropane-fatty-acyl-phospholipid synthase family protein [Burkholderiaceae bacterium]|nr:cyclopropane-fatty-acyl-phospholipid synthase family protein [Burkholderiaceae bacterium]